MTEFRKRPKSRNRTEMFTILFSCDGGPSIGLGHVVRCLALADELKGTYQCRVEFATSQHAVATEMISRAGYTIHLRPASGTPADEIAWLITTVAKSAANFVVFDVRHDLSLSGLMSLRKTGVGIALLDDASERRFAADLVFYPPMPQLQRLDWKEFPGHDFAGWDWVILRRQFRNCLTSALGGRPTVLVTAGGSDPADITGRVIDGLEQLECDIAPVVVLGSACRNSDALTERLSRTRRAYRLLSDVPDMAAIMSQAELAVVSFGMTAYELAAIGVPSIYVSLTTDHAESAFACERAGLGLSLGVHQNVSPTEIAAAVSQLLGDPARRAAMAARGRRLIDGRGAERIARQIIRFLLRNCVNVAQVA